MNISLSHHLFSSDEQTVFKLMKTDGKELISAKAIKPLKPGFFAATLFKFVGAQQATNWIVKLDSSLGDAFIAVWSVHIEILKAKQTSYSIETFLKTTAFIQKYFNNSPFRTVFNALQRDAWSTLPFYQTLVTWDPVPREELDAIATERRIAIQKLDALAQESMDYKGSEPSQTFSHEDIAVHRLFSFRAAVVSAGKMYTYGDLFVTWRPNSDLVGSPVEAFQHVEKGTHWRRFHAECVVRAMEATNQFSWQPNRRNSIIQTLAANAFICSDVAYFTGFPEIFLPFKGQWPHEVSAPMLESLQLFLRYKTQYQLSTQRQHELQELLFSQNGQPIEWENLFAAWTMDRIESQLDVKMLPRLKKEWLVLLSQDQHCREELLNQLLDPPSFFQWETDVLQFQGLQRYLHLQRTYGVAQEKRGALLNMCCSSNTTNILGFELRQWSQPAAEEHAGFTESWSCLQKCRKLDEDSLSGGLPFFIFLFNHPAKRNIWSDFFSDLAQKTGMVLSFESMLLFYYQNASCSVEQLAKFASQYATLINALKEKWPNLHFEQIFFCLPVTILDNLEQIESAHLRASALLDRLGDQSISETTFLRLLKQIISNPTLLDIFDLLKDIRLSPNDQLISFLIQLPIRLTYQNRAAALAWILQVHRTYQFKDIQKLSLYLKALRAETLTSLRQASRVVCDLQKKLPALSRDTVYAIYHYSLPAITLKELDSLYKQYRIQLEIDIREEERLISTAQSNVVGSTRIPTQNGSWNNSIEAWADNIANSVQCDEDIDLLRRGLHTAAFYLFYPASQPISDGLMIANLDPIRGPKWAEEHIATHWGRSIPLSDIGPIEFYTKWEVGPDGRPLFFFTIWDTENQTARSSFVPINAKLNDIHELSNRGNAFFSLLRELAPLLLVYDRTADNQEISQIVKFYETDLTRDTMEVVWTFLLRVKIELAKIHCLSEEEFLDRLNLETPPQEIAAQGHIFRSCSLLPPHLQVEVDPRFYTPDLPLEIASKLPPIFKCPDQKMKKLNVSIAVTDDGIQETPLPLYSSVTESGIVILGFGANTFDGGSFNQTRYVRVPLFYSEHILGNLSLFLTQLNFHLCLLKAEWYQRQISQKPKSSDVIYVAQQSPRRVQWGDVDEKENSQRP